MKHLIFTFSFSIIITSISYAQNLVRDTHPRAVIFAIDYSTGQPVQVSTDTAILFKDAFIDLVVNTVAGKLPPGGAQQGHRSFVITQLNPQTSGNAYQLVLQRTISNQTLPVYTFVYNVDQDSLFVYDAPTQNYIPVPIEGVNQNNLNNCFVFGKFNLQPVVDANAQIGVNAMQDSTITTNNAPPVLQDEQQPECPEEGYLWQPGYWAYNPGNGGYYWVPGGWVPPPANGYLWTPPYWGYDGGFYVFHAGYWGNNVGFYGGVNYGYGYAGNGYSGGVWEGGNFRYNTAVVRVNSRVHNTYVDNTVVFNGARNHAAFNGPGGIEKKPTANESAEMNRHAAEVARARVANPVNRGYALRMVNKNVPNNPVVKPAGVNNAKPANPGNIKPYKQPTNPAPANKVVQPAPRPKVQPQGKKY